MIEPFKSETLDHETYEEGIYYGYESELYIRYEETDFLNDDKKLNAATW